MRSLARGDVAPIVGRIERQIDRAEAHLARSGEDVAGSSRARDVAVVAGIALTMLGIKALKVLPSIPFAPGHKLVILTPLYIIAALKTRSRAGATWTGLTMGAVAFLMGDGRYGIFEIVKHVAPGVAADLLVPLAVRTAEGRAVWIGVGGLIGAARFATIFAITFAVQAPKVAYAILVPGLVVHTTFGAVSGWVTYHLVRAMRAVRAHAESAEAPRREAPCPDRESTLATGESQP